MSQIGNKIKAGFFATPPRQGEYLRDVLTFEQDTSVLDPTCGEGLILKQLTEAREERSFTVKTYGVELDKTRAKLASTVLDKVVQAPIESMVISNDALGMVYLNPPYDNTMLGHGDEKTERKEYTELVRGTRYLTTGGVLMYVIPSYRYADKKIARFLSSYFEDIAITRFTDEDYPDFRQCIFIGKKRKSDNKELNEKLYNFLLQMDDESYVEINVMQLDKLKPHKTWVVKGTKTDINTFYSRMENKSEFIDLIQSNKGFHAFIERTKPKQLELGGQPLINVAQGQMALLLASGAVNGIIGEGNTLHAVQGMEIVSHEVIEEKTEHSIITKKRTKRSVSVKAILPNGKVKKLV